MLHLYKLFFAFCLLALPVAGLSKPDPQLINKLDARRATLEQRIQNEPDPNKRKDYIEKLYQTQEYYLKDNSRKEVVRQLHPELVKQVEYYRALPAEVKEKRLEDSIANQMSKSTEVISDPGQGWDKTPQSQRVFMCTGAANKCMKEEKLSECKFVLLRCEKIIDDKLYYDVKEFVKSKADIAK